MKKLQLKSKYIIIFIIAVALVIAIIFGIIITKNISYGQAKQNSQNGLQSNSKDINLSIPITKQDKSKTVKLDDIISNNEKDVIIEKIEKIETDVDFTTQYRENNSLSKGKMQTIQEGADGKQNAIVKNYYKNGELVSSNQISSEITKVSQDKIVEIGTASYSNNYVPIVGDVLEATSISLTIRVDPGETAEKLITIKKGDKVTLKAKQEDWYYVDYQGYIGWAQKDSFTYYNPNANSDGDENNAQYTKEELTQNLGFSMLLNKKSGLSLEQFKKILSNDSNDKQNVFTQNAEYFYYAEKQYNLNGLFVAAVGIHESGWGTSAISLNKKNLFGYGAYDSDPYGKANLFESYSAGIDLVSRVFVKYYINPKGTPIYNGEYASGTYYKGSTLTAVNKSYATDTNWANAVYKWMMYLYNKL